MPNNIYDLYSVKVDWPNAVEAVAKRGTIGDVENIRLDRNECQSHLAKHPYGSGPSHTLC